MKKEKKLSEAQFKKLVRDMARQAIKEHVARKVKGKKAPVVVKEATEPKTKKVTVDELKQMIRESVSKVLKRKLQEASKKK